MGVRAARLYPQPPPGVGLQEPHGAGEAGRRRLALGVVRHLLVQFPRDALGDPAPAPALHHLRIDGHPAVLHAEVPQDLHLPGAFVQFDHHAMGGVGERPVVADVEACRRAEPRFDVLGQQMRPQIRQVGRLLVADRGRRIVPAVHPAAADRGLLPRDVPRAAAIVRSLSPSFPAAGRTALPPTAVDRPAKVPQP
ncbi:hypothetical protein GCM10010211_27840 [Streptomyces albospinus]|uniref:Uncharacterized protein n=1 Tax=Streptomyces albospinus TaxID=285515 RepID=A0ABQ2UZI6_9ACTN|nr:hypothetical protein GCM10010211_27840 [Streptomyces albospinus]